MPVCLSGRERGRPQERRGPTGCPGRCFCWSVLPVGAGCCTNSQQKCGLRGRNVPAKDAGGNLEECRGAFAKEKCSLKMEGLGGSAASFSSPCAPPSCRQSSLPFLAAAPGGRTAQRSQ